jgi:hypothetical protein
MAAPLFVAMMVMLVCRNFLASTMKSSAALRQYHSLDFSDGGTFVGRDDRPILRHG